MKEVLIRLDRCLGCKSCQLACAVQHSQSKNLVQAIGETPPPQNRVHVTKGEINPLPVQCRHCQEAPCVDACMTGALHYDSQGLVVLDNHRCTGCWMCIMTCPFGAVTPGNSAKLAVKCDRCPDLAQPACVTACPTKSLVFADPADLAKEVREQLAWQVTQQK
ncbi:MAG: 4Fe-4S dicluster domain-containing protein [Clostridia bacterium]|nr:4Fe-4S dicluster domain-containing protein [Clostridia bacterium]